LPYTRLARLRLGPFGLLALLRRPFLLTTSFLFGLFFEAAGLFFLALSLGLGFSLFFLTAPCLLFQSGLRAGG
jgi:hypothetical protein